MRSAVPRRGGEKLDCNVFLLRFLLLWARLKLSIWPSGKQQLTQSRSMKSALYLLKVCFFPTFSYLHVRDFPQSGERVPFEPLQRHIHGYISEGQNTGISNPIWCTYCLLNGDRKRKSLLSTTCLPCKKESSVPAVLSVKSKRCFHKPLWNAWLRKTTPKKAANSLPNLSVCQSRGAISQECTSIYTLPRNQSPCAHVLVLGYKYALQITGALRANDLLMNQTNEIFYAQADWSVWSKSVMTIHPPIDFFFFKSFI